MRKERQGHSFTCTEDMKSLVQGKEFETQIGDLATSSLVCHLLASSVKRGWRKAPGSSGSKWTVPGSNRHYGGAKERPSGRPGLWAEREGGPGRAGFLTSAYQSFCRKHSPGFPCP